MSFFRVNRDRKHGMQSWIMAPIIATCIILLQVSRIFILIWKYIVPYFISFGHNIPTSRHDVQWSIEPGTLIFGNTFKEAGGMNVKWNLQERNTINKMKQLSLQPLTVASLSFKEIEPQLTTWSDRASLEP